MSGPCQRKNRCLPFQSSSPKYLMSCDNCYESRVMGAGSPDTFELRQRAGMPRLLTFQTGQCSPSPPQHVCFMYLEALGPIIQPLDSVPGALVSSSFRWLLSAVSNPWSRHKATYRVSFFCPNMRKPAYPAYRLSTSHGPQSRGVITPHGLIPIYKHRS